MEYGLANSYVIKNPVPKENKQFCIYKALLNKNWLID